MPQTAAAGFVNLGHYLTSLILWLVFILLVVAAFHHHHPPHMLPPYDASDGNPVVPSHGD